MKEIIIGAFIVFSIMISALVFQPKNHKQITTGTPIGTKVQKICTFPGYCLDIKDKSDFDYCLGQNTVCEWVIK